MLGTSKLKRLNPVSNPEQQMLETLVASIVVVMRTIRKAPDLHYSTND